MSAHIDPTGSVESEFTAFVFGRCLLNVEKRAWAKFQEISRLQVESKLTLSEQFECYSEEIETIRENYMQHLTEIYELVGKHMATPYYDCAKRIETILSDCKASLMKLVSEKVQSDGKPFASEPPKSALFFSGSMGDWLEFRESFEKSIVNNSTMNDSQKLAALQTSVSKQITDQKRGTSFEALWQKLSAKFDRFAIRYHVDALLHQNNLSPLSNAQDVDNLLSTCDRHVQSLSKLGYPLDSLSEVIICRIVKWRTPHPNRRILDKFDRHESWTEIKASLPQLVRSDPVQSTSQVPPKELECFYCKGKHFLRKCIDFCQLEFKERFQLITVKWKLCTMCFSVYHLTPNCHMKVMCRLCKGRHNTVLHPEDNDKAKLKLLDGMLAKKG